MADAAVSFRDLTLGYHSHPAVHHLSGAIARGALTAVVGANGSGKSTLLKGIVGMLKPMGGAVTVAPNIRTAYLPQQSELDRSFPARIVDLVSLGLWRRLGLFGRRTGDDRVRVTEALSAVGLGGFERRSIDSVSGGQLQRALFARVLVQDADLILLDEPFNAIDARTVTDLLTLISRWHGEGRTIVVVVHDLDMVRNHFPEALLLARRPVAWGEARQALSAENLLRARRFHEAWDEDAPWCATDEPPLDAHVHEHDHPHHHAHDHAEPKHRGIAFGETLAVGDPLPLEGRGKGWGSEAGKSSAFPASFAPLPDSIPPPLTPPLKGEGVANVEQARRGDSPTPQRGAA